MRGDILCRKTCVYGRDTAGRGGVVFGRLEKGQKQATGRREASHQPVSTDRSALLCKSIRH